MLSGRVRTRHFIGTANAAKR